MAEDAPKGQNLLSQGDTLGGVQQPISSPCQGSTFRTRFMILPLQSADLSCDISPRVLPWAMRCCPCGALRESSV